MSVRIGIYDFFAYTIPGSLYLTTIAYLCSTLGLIQIDSQVLSALSTLQVILLAILAYTIGLVLDPIAKQWYRLFKPKDLSKTVLDEFKQAHPELNVKFGTNDWPIIFAYLRQESDEIAHNIERLNATNIMLRNLSFNLVILSAIQMVRLLQANFYVLDVILLAVFVVLSLISGRESVRFARWFYSGQYQAIAAQSLKASDWVEKRPKVQYSPSDKVSDD